eukprot:3689396-Pleurochrysis_carterae.AAC.1
MSSSLKICERYAESITHTIQSVLDTRRIKRKSALPLLLPPTSPYCKLAASSVCFRMRST